MNALTEPTHHSLIAGQPVRGKGGTVRGIDPAAETGVGPEFTLLAVDQVEEATAAAEKAFATYRSLEPAVRAAFLITVAENINAAGEDIVATAKTETGLPDARLKGELVRTVNQLKLFARVVESGDHFGVRIEPALPERTPLPRPDLRQLKLPLGPVAVFGASNFPLAFSVAGGDTASALAAGCPVVFKAHNAHPGTSQLVARAIAAAVTEHHLPRGVFSLVYGPGAEVGQALVKDSRIQAVGFTGSRSAGTALVATAAAREVPIPVYAEMSSVNPIFIFDSALREGPGTLAEDFIKSLNGSAGQLCTAPGLVFVPETAAGDEFVSQISQQLVKATGVVMLTRGICSARIKGEKKLASIAGVERVGRGREGDTENAPAPAVYSTGAANFLATPELAEEIFGAVCLVVRYSSSEQLAHLARNIEGQLTVALRLNPENDEDVRAVVELLPQLERKAGRLLVNDWPTGVDVGDAMVHGGPYPATSDGRSTSVGTLAIDRFLRPVVYQNLPEALLPAQLRDGNPWGLTRRVNGEYQLPG